MLGTFLSIIFLVALTGSIMLYPATVRMLVHQP
jgi:hypothetical protein